MYNELPEMLTLHEDAIINERETFFVKINILNSGFQNAE